MPVISEILGLALGISVIFVSLRYANIKLRKLEHSETLREYKEEHNQEEMEKNEKKL